MTAFPLSPPSPTGLRFSVGRHLRRADRILPVFLPFAGCPGRCVFCAQDRQTGTGEDVGAALDHAAVALEETAARGASGGVELAFYGGTFTALPPAPREAALTLFTRYRARGVVSHGRCSTRPDALNAAADGVPVLDRLAGAGLDLVELGVQSFDDTALTLSRRGYDGRAAEAGCRAVRRAGLALGIQLLPGMPGVTPEVFLRDVDRALALHPACLRFYPCLVPEGTGLAALWRAGRYAPWSAEDTVSALGEGLRRAWAAGVPVVRLAVAPEAAFDASLLAGPRHPALGSMVQAEALLATVRKARERLGRPPERLSLPRGCQGYMYGQHGALRGAWAALALPPERVRFHAAPADEGILS